MTSGNSLWSWETTAGNNDAGGALFPENQTRSSLNNGMRQVQAEVRTFANDSGWAQYGDGTGSATIAYVSAISFSIAGTDVTLPFHQGRRIKAVGSSTGTIYGTIRSSTFSTNTTVVVDWDDAGALISETLTIWLASQPETGPQTPEHGASRPNVLRNGQFLEWSAGTALTSLNDGTITADHCYVLSDGNDAADISKETTTKPTGAPASLKAEVETANVKFGFLFPIEAADARMLAGGTASLSFRARAGASNSGLDSIRAAVISWDGSADNYTLDIVSAWNAVDVNPTLVTNWTYENAAFSITLETSAWRRYRLQNISIDTAGTTNVAVFIWVNDTNASVDDLLYLADVKLEPGPVATPIPREASQRTAITEHAARLDQAQTFAAIQTVETGNDSEYPVVVKNSSGNVVDKVGVDASGHGSIQVADSTGAVTAELNAATGQLFLEGSATTGKLVQPLATGLGTTQATTSGTTWDFSTTLAAVQRITVFFNGFNTTGAEDALVQIGTSGGLKTDSYVSRSQRTDESAGSVVGAASTSGFIMVKSDAAAAVTGKMVIEHMGSNRWIATHDMHEDGDDKTGNGSGKVTLSGALTQVRITTTGTPDTGDGGLVNVRFE